VLYEINFRNVQDPNLRKTMLNNAFETVSDQWIQNGAIYNLLEDNCRKFTKDMLDYLQP